MKTKAQLAVAHIQSMQDQMRREAQYRQSLAQRETQRRKRWVSVDTNKRIGPQLRAADADAE